MNTETWRRYLSGSFLCSESRYYNSLGGTVELPSAGTEPEDLYVFICLPESGRVRLKGDCGPF
jgi:hypothetical protein